MIQKNMGAVCDPLQTSDVQATALRFQNGQHTPVV